MREAEFEKLKGRILHRLRMNLPKHLLYHCAEHTERVLVAAEYIAIQEKISGHDLFLLKTAVLFHDIGFLKTYEDHEDEGMTVVRAELPGLKFSDADIETICGMIQATRIPQKINNRLEAVVADADLEYLGTSDFEQISNNLFLEIKHRRPELTIEAWDLIQIEFLESHHYFTMFGKVHLEPAKQLHLNALKLKMGLV